MTQTATTYTIRGFNSRGQLIFTDWRKSQAAAEKLAESKRTPTAIRTGATYTVTGPESR